MLLDGGVDPVVHERDARGVPGEAEGGSGDDSDVHGACSFDGQAEPEAGLGAEGAAVAPGLARADAVHGLERPAEGLCRAVAVAHGDAQQVPGTRDDLRRGDRHAPAAHVLRQRHPGQRGEHATQVVLGRAERRGEPDDVEVLGEVLLDEVDELVEPGDHGAPFRCPLCRPRAGGTRSSRSVAIRCSDRWARGTGGVDRSDPPPVRPPRRPSGSPCRGCSCEVHSDVDRHPEATRPDLGHRPQVHRVPPRDDGVCGPKRVAQVALPDPRQRRGDGDGIAGSTGRASGDEPLAAGILAHPGHVTGFSARAAAWARAVSGFVSWLPSVRALGPWPAPDSQVGRSIACADDVEPQLDRSIPFQPWVLGEEITAQGVVVAVSPGAFSHEDPASLRSECVITATRSGAARHWTTLHRPSPGVGLFFERAVRHERALSRPPLATRRRS